MLRCLSAVGLVLVLVSGTPCQGVAGAATPTEVVRTFQKGLLAVMKEAESLGVDGRYRRLAPLVTQSFRLPLMARIAAGAYWNTANDTQRRRFVSAFSRMGVSTLATLFDGHNGETFKVLGERPVKRVVLVDTHIVRPDDAPVDITYVVGRFDEGWYMIDVLLDRDVSELKVRQSEYRAVLAKGGIEALIAILDRKADELLGQ